jgi:hypothetical protein
MFGGRFQSSIGIFLLILAIARPVFADWAGFSKFGAVAEIAIEERAAHMHLRILDSAWPELAHNAEPAAPGQAVDIEEAAAGLIGLRDDAGRLLPVRRSASPESRAPAGSGPRGAATPFREIEIDFALPEHPSAVTIQPTAGVRAGLIGLIVLHRGVPASDLVPLEKPARLQLDWADPWRSHFDDGAMVRHHSEPRSFIYVEPYEVRHEILIRLKDVLPRLGFHPADGKTVAAPERESFQKALGEYFRANNPLSIDGKPAAPELDRVEFVRFDRQGIGMVGDSEPLDIASGLAGVILVHLTDRPAQKVDLCWQYFGGNDLPRTVSVQYGIESFDSYVTRENPCFQWTSDDVFQPAEVQRDEALTAGPQVESPRVPRAVAVGFRYTGGAIAMAAIVGFVIRRRPWKNGAPAELVLLLAVAACVGFYPDIVRVPEGSRDAPRPLPEEAAKAELHALLHNIYRAFQIRGEEAAYDRLALSLDGDVLEEIYLRQREALRQRAQGLGGEGRVNRIEILDSRVAASNARDLRVAARWVAHGIVSHWGHSHERSNEYRANLVLRPALDGRWKITEIEFLDTRRRGSGPAAG